MKTLLNLIPYNHKIAVYIPSTINVDKKTSNLKQVNRTLKTLSECFGGATSTKALGSWLSDSGKLIKESVTIVYAYCSESDLERYLDSTILPLCEKLKIDMSQESIALEVDNKMYFI